MPSCERINAITGFSHSGANSLELVSGSLTTSRANSMIAACNPRQIPRKGSLCSRAQRIASSMPSTPRTPKPPGTSNPSYVPSSSPAAAWSVKRSRSEEHTSELQSQSNLVCRLLLEKKKNHQTSQYYYTFIIVSLQHSPHCPT